MSKENSLRSANRVFRWCTVDGDDDDGGERDTTDRRRRDERQETTAKTMLLGHDDGEGDKTVDVGGEKDG